MKDIPSKTCRDCAQTFPVSEFPKHRNRCRTCHLSFRKKLDSQGKEARLRRMYGSKYGVTLEHVQTVYADQKGQCAICELELPPLLSYTPRWYSAVLDHDHETGLVRGLLCSACNLMIGHAKDDTKVLYNGIVYLAERNTKARNRGTTDEEAEQDGKEGRQSHGRVQGRDPA